MAWYKPWTWGDESSSSKDKREDLNNQGAMSSIFADQGQEQYGALGGQLREQADYLRQQAAGKNSISAEQLRQGLQQNLAGQRSIAASASPANAAMAARSMAGNSARLGYGMSGQAATAGLQERQQAQQALAELLLRQRQQEQAVALGSRQNATTAYGGTTPEGSTLDKWGNAVVAGFGVASKSDKRAKTEIEDGDAKARRVVEGLKAYSYKYKDARDGKGEQFGPMAQDMEAAGLGHAVINTPGGKMVHGAKAALSGLALTAALARRVAKLEGKGGK